jgi:hypothetical protein
MAYPRHDGRQKQCAVGLVTHQGTDFMNYAGLPYVFSQDLVDEFRLGFGLWSRSRTGLYRWAAHDIEAGAHGKATTTAQAHLEALQAYQAHLSISEGQGNALLTMLEESSPGRYHVWTVFRDSISQEEHDRFVHSIELKIGNLACLDKTTCRGRKGLGDQFRAPCSWKGEARSRILDYRLADQDLVLQMAARCSPELCADPDDRLVEIIEGRIRAGKYGNKAFKSPRTSIPSLAKEMIGRYPLTGPGQRNKMTAKVILCLINRKLTANEVNQVVVGWLQHYAPLMRTPLETAKQEAIRCRDRTYRRLQDGTLAPARPRIDHWFMIDHHREILPCFRNLSKNNHSLCHPLHGEDDRCWERLERIVTPAEMPYVYGLLLLILHKILKTDERVMQLVDDQWLEAVGRITGRKPHWRQLQRIRDRFITRKKKGKLTRASKWELLREIRKGRVGFPSQYRLTGIAPAFEEMDAGLLSQVLLQPDAFLSVLEEACEGISLARDDVPMQIDGPEAGRIAHKLEDTEGTQNGDIDDGLQLPA